MSLKKIFFSWFCFFILSTTYCQSIIIDSPKIIDKDSNSILLTGKEKEYNVGDDKVFIYQKPKPFGFLTNLPKDAAEIASVTFQKKSVKPLLWIAGSTVILLFADQSITNGVQRFSRNIDLHPEEDYKDVLDMPLSKKNASLLKAPQNLNTALYQVGQGFPGLVIGASLFVYGKIHKDYRAISTANQLAESFILMGISTQLLKRITGRQSPSEATSSGGTWHFFPSFKQFQNHTPNYDAFPSGHIATLMSTITILSENYPEKKWIKPIGYSITGLVGYAMINNKVHWASDYPLALALGYLCAKQVVKNNRKLIRAGSTNKPKATLSYTFNYTNGRLMPGVIYKF